MKNEKRSNIRYSHRKECRGENNNFLLQIVISSAIVLGILVTSKFTGIGTNVHNTLRYQVNYSQTIQKILDTLTKEDENKEETKDAMDNTPSQIQDS